jgi:DNA polymerase-3 subunit delta
MTEINYKEFKNYLQKLDKDGFASVYLIYGEELIYKTILKELLDQLIPDRSNSLNYEPVNGGNEYIYDAIERVNTFSLLQGSKVVAIINSQIFYSKQDKEALLEKVKEEYDIKDIKKASKHLLGLLGLLNLSFDDIDKENRSITLKLDSGVPGDDGWLDEIIDYCLANKLSIPVAKDNIKILQDAVEKGFPAGNHLIITTDYVDKRRNLFKAINNNGMIVDCLVPKGNRLADKKAQEAVLYERTEATLAQSKKKMDKRTFAAMCEMTGFDLHTFSNNLEKLINYIGDRSDITINDVNSVLKRTKTDAIYELTNAIGDRNAEKALFFLGSLLSQSIHPLQALTSVINLMRKLLLIKSFVESEHGGSWNGGIQYYQFQKAVMPAIQKYDRALLDKLEDWENMLAKGTNNESEKKGKAKKKKPDTDLLIAKSAGQAYPVFQMFLKSENYTRDELLDAFEHLGRADRLLKSSGHNPKLILEDVIFHVCRPQTA